SFFGHPPPTRIYTLSLHDALPISRRAPPGRRASPPLPARSLKRPACRVREPWRRGRAVSSWIDPARFQRRCDLVDARDERGLAERDALRVRELPDTVESVVQLVGETRADLV